MVEPCFSLHLCTKTDHAPVYKLVLYQLLLSMLVLKACFAKDRTQNYEE